MLKATLILVSALLCILLVQCEGNPAENNAQTSFEKLFEEASQKLQAAFQSIKDTSDKNGWTEEATKLTNKVKEFINLEGSKSP